MFIENEAIEEILDLVVKGVKQHKLLIDDDSFMSGYNTCKMDIINIIERIRKANIE